MVKWGSINEFYIYLVIVSDFFGLSVVLGIENLERNDSVGLKGFIG